MVIDFQLYLASRLSKTLIANYYILSSPSGQNPCAYWFVCILSMVVVDNLRFCQIKISFSVGNPYLYQFFTQIRKCCKNAIPSLQYCWLCGYQFLKVLVCTETFWAIVLLSLWVESSKTRQEKYFSFQVQIPSGDDVYTILPKL